LGLFEGVRARLTEPEPEEFLLLAALAGGAALEEALDAGTARRVAAEEEDVTMDSGS
jgi:hypothetical protein